MVTRTVDLRFDTVTKTTEAMRDAMETVEVDDDVLGVDPTTVPVRIRGTMCNLISVLIHYDIRGSGCIYENGGISTFQGIHPRPLKKNDDGTMDINSIKATIRDSRGEIVYPTTRMVCLENLHANTRGRGLSVEYIDKVGEIAKKYT
ncbi:probable low-specificity L-threonine aldolase 1 [Hibiscus syriacus]|uniref:probable low-specificity L-threonine aldolase 1 n=1 Tax=Hibiscus syriacus TaxID=106335 RepID=UPI001923C4AA|nr:probable low-specificity L-threonine aldolase 1 [Hibiscus syriacus]